MGRTFDPKNGKKPEPLFYSSSIHDAQVHADARAKKLLTWGIVAVGLTIAAFSAKPVRDCASKFANPLDVAAKFVLGQ